MKAIKFHVDKALWERFYRLFPGHGERSGILRKIVRNIISLSDSHVSLAERASDSVWEDLLGEEEKER
jgi:hypothetical protein